MPDSRTAAELLSAWRQGDEEAASILFDRYSARLLALTRARLSTAYGTRVDPEDIVQSAYRSFFLGARAGRFGVQPEEDLWPLLATLTVRKLRRQVRRHSAESRAVQREVCTPDEVNSDFLGQDPTPDAVALVHDELSELLCRLEPIAREVLLRQLRGESAADISHALGLSERTVRRYSADLRERLECGVDAAVSPRVRQSGGDPQVEQRVPPTIGLRELRLLQCVGQGAFSKVYRAMLLETGTAVAVKFLRKPLWNDVRASSSLLREYSILKDLRHPNILRVVGLGVATSGAPFLVTEWLEGGVLGREKMSVDSCRSVLKDVAEGLIAAHEAGLVHGDLKPQNVFRRRDGCCVLIDFGMSRRFQWDDDYPRGGTAGFLAPEQIAPAFGEIGPRSDVYGWGALGYSLLSGHPPFFDHNLSELIAQVLASRSPVALQDLVPEIPARLADLIHRCLAKDAAERPESLQSVCAELGEMDQETI